MRMRQLLVINLLVILVCSLVVGFSWVINRNAIKSAALSIFQAQGRAAFSLIQATRHWNAQQTGVYVPVSSQTPPNPYLELPDRDITDDRGRVLTRVNPAYMTRQISEILTGTEVEMHISSQTPINPLNRPDAWEHETLEWMKREGEVERVTREGDKYRYMAALHIVHSCLQCHEKEGYKIGDLRGGISFTRPSSRVDPLVEVMLERVDRLHLGAWILLSAVASLLGSLAFRFRQRLLGSVAIQQALRTLVETDQLTGLLSRRELMRRLSQEILRASRFRVPLGVMMVDIDYFKQVNDQYGHSEGDLVLQRVAQALRQTLRSVDSIGRYGGEEFMVLLPNTGLRASEQLAQRLLESVRQLEIDLGTGRVIKVSVSIGVSCTELSEGPCSVDDMIRRSDQALYVAKRSGRARVCCDCVENSMNCPG